MAFVKVERPAGEADPPGDSGQAQGPGHGRGHGRGRVEICIRRSLLRRVAALIAHDHAGAMASIDAPRAPRRPTNALMSYSPRCGSMAAAFQHNACHPSAVAIKSRTIGSRYPGRL